MRVEPLGVGEPSRAIQRLLPGGEEPLAALLDAASRHPSGALVAFEGGEPRAVLRGGVLHAGYLVTAIDGPGESLGRAVPALIEHLGVAFPEQRIEARFEGETRGDPELRRALVNASAAMVLDQVRYERDLGELPAPASHAFELRGYRAIGKAALVALLAWIFAEGPSGCVTSDPYDEAERVLFLARDAGGEPDTSRWIFAFADGAPAGLALAQVLGEGLGTLLYFGVVPSMRRRKVGAALHAIALRRLAEAGAAAYVDATAGGNTAMRRVFEGSGCRPTGVVLHHVLRRPLDSGHLVDVDALAAYLRGERHRVDVSPGSRLHTDAGCEGEAARVEIAWDAGARVVHVTGLHPSPVSAERREAAGRIVARAGAPGFFFEERGLGTGFRVAILLDEAGRLRVQQLRRALAETVRAVAALRAGSPAVAAAGASLLERVPVFRPGSEEAEAKGSRRG